MIKLKAKARLYAEKFRDYTQRLRELGLKKLGEGAHGIAYEHPTNPNIAVKVVDNDPVNLSWLKFCQAHAGNPYVPKIYHLQAIDLDDKRSAYIAFMEKLKPLSVERYLKFLTTLDPKFAKAPTHTRYLMVNYDKLWRGIAKNTSDKSLVDIAHYLSTLDDDLDISEDNLMLRGNQIVFVDPVANELSNIETRRAQK